MNFLKKLMATSLVVALLPALPAKAAQTQAKIEFDKSESPFTTNIAKWDTVGDNYSLLHPMRVEGIWGHSTNKDGSLGNGSTNGIEIDIDDAFMHNLPAGQKVKLTIEYWDGAHPQFKGNFNAQTDDTFARIRVHYDSNGSGDKISGDGDAVTHLTSDLFIRNRNKWNSVSYIIDDFKAGNGIDNKWDLRITDWGGETNVARDVIYKSVKIEYYQNETGNPLVLTDRINLGVAGNFEDITKENLSLNIPMENTSKNEIVARWYFEIYDENNIFVDSFKHSSILAGNQKCTDVASFKNPGLCGVYEIKATVDVTMPDGDIISKYMGDENFSIAHISAQGQGNDDIGINVHAATGGHGDFKTILDVLSRAGFGWVREADAQNHGKNSRGEWKAGDIFMSNIRYVHEKDMKLLLQLWGPRWAWENGTTGGCIPLNDADRQQFADWCEDLAIQTNGYIDAVEVFNETGTTMFPSNYSGNKGEEYAKALKVAYEAIKGVNSNVSVVGPVTANQNEGDRDFSRQVYSAGGLNYMDIHSTHRYPYIGTPYIKELLTYAGKDLEEEIILEYSNSSPVDGMWVTEYGHNTENKLADGTDTGGVAHPWDDTYWDETFEIGYYDSVPRRTQAQGLALGYAVTQGFSNSFDKLFVHNAIDFSDLTDSEHSWGVMNSYTGAEGYTPYSAKQSLVATAAYNHFIDDTSTVKGTIGVDQDHHGDWNQMHAIWFGNSNNSKFNKDVIYLQSEVGEYVNVTLNVGASSFDVYDMYGNLLGTMSSGDGKYKLKVTPDPYYLVGDFTKLSKETTWFATYPTVSNNIIKNCVQGTTKTFNLSGLSNVSSIEITGFEKISSTSNSITVKVPDIYEGRAYGHVKVLNSNGTLQAILPVEMWIDNPELYIRATETNLDIHGMTDMGGNDISVWVTNSNNSPIGLAQGRATEGRIFDISLAIPDANSELCNVKLFNGSMVLQQQVIPGVEMSYSCKLNGETVPLAALDTDDFTNEDNVEISLKLTNNSGNTNPHITLYGACYNSDREMLYFAGDATDGTSWNGGNSETLTISVNKNNADSLRIFVWDNNFKPLKKVTDVN